MREASRRWESESQINDYILLGEILRKERSAMKQEAVDAVLRSRSSLKEKIERISHIDQTGERFASRGRRPEDSAVEPESGIILDSVNEYEQNELLIIKRNRSKLMRTHTENPFFRYVFREYGKIRRFAVRSGMLSFRFPFQLRLNRDALERISAVYQPGILKMVLAVLEQLIRDGWSYLEKYEYNCIVVFHEFCKSLMKADFLGLPRGDRDLLQRFAELERYFLVLQGDRQIRDTVFSALEKSMDAAPGRAAEVRECGERARNLTAESDRRPTLGNLFLALNMMSWRRFFVLSDLIHGPAGRLASDAVFDCPNKVRLAIHAYIADQEAVLGRLIQERAQILKERVLIPVDPKGEIDHGTLMRFYNERTESDSASTFSRDSEKILLLLVRLVDLFMKTYRPLFCNTLAFEPSGTGFLFEPSVFGSDFDTLAHVAKKLERHAYSYGSITRQRFLEIRNTNKTATRIEAEEFSLAKEVLAALHAIVQKLAYRLSEKIASFSAGSGPEPGPSGGASLPEFDPASWREKPRVRHFNTRRRSPTA
jgi:hypothetical protein